jgi:hypothetical protein
LAQSWKRCQSGRSRRDVNQRPVVADGHVQGVLGRADVFAGLESRVQFAR